jgi:hypothetical protein
MPNTSPVDVKTGSASFFQRYWAFGAIAVFYGFALLLTTPRYFGDTGVYVHDILLFDKGAFSRYPNPLWEFGHLYWRPIGWVLFKCFGGLTPFAETGQETLAVTTVLVAFTMICGFVCALLYYSLASSLLQNPWKALLVSAGALSFYGFLNYVHTGCVYVVGLMGVLGGVWAVVRAIGRGKLSWQYGLTGGASIAFAVLVWFPYILVMPAILATALLWRGKREGEAATTRCRLRLACYVAVFAVCLIGIGYLFALIQLKMSSFAELQAWVGAASHGWSQNKRLIRMASGLPRSFLHTGENGIALKRFLLKDPYAHVTLASLIRQDLWGPLAFFVFALCLIRVSWRSWDGRRVLCVCLAAVVPVLGFAAFVFESGSIERYMPLYPFVALAIAYGFSQLSTKTAGPIGIVVFVILAIAVNGASLSKPAIDAETVPAAVRVESLQGKVTPEGLVALVTHQDAVYQLLTSHPFHPTNRRETLPAYDVIEVANERIVRWQPDFAKRAFDTLARSQSVWISNRLLAEHPEAVWNWTEGDDPRISWKELPPFFRQFSYSESVGGADGFLKLEPSRENLAKLQLIADHSIGSR